MDKNILIISYQNQFGYHTDYYNYAKYLSEQYNVIFLSIDQGLEKIKLNRVKTIYIENEINKYKKIYSFTNNIRRIINEYNPEYVLVKYYKGCSLVKSVVSKENKCIMDIRTASITPNNVKRRLEDILMKIEGMFFKYKTVITKNIGEKLGLKNAMVLPLGGKVFPSVDLNEKLKSDRLDLIYVGTLNGRRITDTIEAFNELSNKYNGESLSYTIITNTLNNEEYIKVKDLIKSNRYGNIKLLNTIQNDMLGEYFKNCNIGISYVPTIDYYNFQPPTKTYEYLFNGLFTIATNTYENRNIINNNNGILIKDDKENLLQALEYLYQNKYILDKTREDIFKTIKSYSWDSIGKKLDNYISKI